MEIVHFSVSGTASAGRDGVTGNQLGAIDFVYDDTQGNIATIDKTGQTGGPNNTGDAQTATEFYSNYYASQCLLYSNSELKDDKENYIVINQSKVWVRRYLVQNTEGTGGYHTAIKYQVTDPGQTTNKTDFLVKQYAINSDAVEKAEIKTGTTE